MAEFNPIRDISLIDQLLLVVEDMVFDTRREIGHLLFNQTTAAKIPMAIDEMRQRLDKLSQDIVADKVEGANEANASMFNACLAGVAIADPTQAPHLVPLLQTEHLHEE